MPGEFPPTPMDFRHQFREGERLVAPPRRISELADNRIEHLMANVQQLVDASIGVTLSDPAPVNQRFHLREQQAGGTGNPAMPMRGEHGAGELQQVYEPQAVGTAIVVLDTLREDVVDQRPVSRIEFIKRDRRQVRERRAVLRESPVPPRSAQSFGRDETHH